MRTFSLASCIAAAAALLLAEPAASQVQRVTPQSKQQVQLSFASVSQKASPAVVNVYAARVVVQRRMLSDDPILRQFGLGLGVPEQRVQQSLGSGVIVRADGIIVTNNHVVEGAQALKVVLDDRREFDARLVLADKASDLAVLRIDAKALPTLGFADTSATQVGDMVLAIGNPFGLSQTVTSGIVSAVSRTGVANNNLNSFIQTDAAINQGNSGGALVDMNGDLVGVNTAIFSLGGGSNGVGFAIPAEMVRRVVDSALSGEKAVVRAWLGAKGQTVTQQYARNIGLPSPTGVLVSDVYPGGAADQAGLQKGDVVLKVNGGEILDEAQLRYQTGVAAPGSMIAMEILRNGARRTLQARAAPPPRTIPADPRMLKTATPLAGAQVANLSPAEAEALGVDPFAQGVCIKALAPNGPAARYFRRGDIIRGVNGQPVRSSADLEQAVSRPAAAWIIDVERNGQRNQLRFPA